MAKITPKENWLRLARGEDVAYIPRYTMMNDEYLGECPTKRLFCSVIPDTRMEPGGHDMWGVPMVSDPYTGANMPDTTKILLHDINDWEKVVKFPEIPDVDLERVYEADLKATNCDRTQSAVMAGPPMIMPFQDLMALMGFTEGLMAMITDPEPVKDMLNAMVDLIEPLIWKTVDVYKPDIWALGDDSCAKAAPFISMETYRDILKPIYMRLCKPALERGIPVSFHNCGRFEDQIDDMLDFGVKYFDPCQQTNDLLGIQKKYKGKVVIVGGWDWDHHMPRNWPDFDEEEIRQGVRDTIDTFGPGGGFAFGGGVPGMNEATMKVNQIVCDEVHWYGRKFTGYTD